MAVIRLAVTADAPRIHEVYRPIVEGTAISFELEPPAVEELERRVVTVLETHPWLVCEADGALLGYAYASRHRERAAYQWSADVSVYVAAGARRRGVGLALYGSLLEVLRLQGFFNAYAGITLPNAASVRVHEAAGFQPVGVYRRVGYKLGTWHDVGWWSRDLRELVPAPPPPLALTAALELPGWEAALAAGLPRLRL